MKRVGLIVNPVAGLGGRVGLKGSDGAEIQQQAIALGAVPRATERAAEALTALSPMKNDLEIYTYPEEMGENAASRAGFSPIVVGQIKADHTTAEDTKRAVRELLSKDLSLLLFAGGDGTARDIYEAGGAEISALGIPAGVKIHSAAYAIHPHAAGELALASLRGETELSAAEVMDIDEEAFRQGRLSAKLYGYLKVPYLERYVQGAKAASPRRMSTAFKGIAEDLSERMSPGKLYIFGPGSSIHAIAGHLGFEKTLLGVDAILDGRVIAADANESKLLELLERHPEAEIVVTPIGGQGCVLGRGNQQISPQVMRKVGVRHVQIVSTPEKLQALRGQPLWIDTGESSLDQELGGYYAVITGYQEYVMYKVT